MDTEVLIDLSDAISAYVDELAAACTDGFARQLREQAGEGDRRRRQFAELLLRGGAAGRVPSRDGGRRDRLARRWTPWCRSLLPLDQARDARFRYRRGRRRRRTRRDAVLLLRAGPRVDSAAARGGARRAAARWWDRRSAGRGCRRRSGWPS